MLPVLTLRLAGFAAAGALAAPAVGARGVAVWNILLVIATAVDWVRTPRPERVTVTRAAPAVMTRGTTGELTWTVHNPIARPLRVALADDLPRALGAPTRRAAATVPSGGRTRRSVALHPRRRGRFVLGRITLRVTGPWGLAARQRWRQMNDAVTVYPSFPSRTAIELRLRQARQLVPGERTVRQRGTGLDFDSLRDYTVDDEIRRIDWAATARSSQAIVRTYRADRNQTVLVLVDCGRTMAALVGATTAHDRVAPAPTEPDAPSPTPDRAAPADEPIARLEHAIDAAQGITRLATGMGDRVGLVAYADRVLATLPPRNQADQLRQVTAALAATGPHLLESDHAGAFAATLRRFPRRALLLVLTELANEAAVQTLLPALGLLRRRHLVVVGSVRDPVVERWRLEPSDTVEQVYRRAAAIRTLEQRAATATRLRAAGATVVDALPGDLASAVADTYLDTKAAGRL